MLNILGAHVDVHNGVETGGQGRRERFGSTGNLFGESEIIGGARRTAAEALT